MNQAVERSESERAFSASATVSWSDDESGIEIHQFTEKTFDTSQHSFSRHALLFVFTGVIQLQLEDTKSVRLLPGEGVFHAAGHLYNASAQKPSSFIVVSFPERILTPEFENLGWQSQVIHADSQLMSIIDLLDRELGIHDHHQESSLNQMSKLLATHLIRNYSLVPTALPTKSGRADLCEVMAALEFIELNITCPLTVSDINQSGSLSAANFLRTFKEVTGQTPQQYIIRRRVEIAKYLLRRKELSIDAIAKKVGFVDQSHLTKAFRKFYGVTPAECRHR